VGVGVCERGPGVCERVGERLMLLVRVGPGVCERAGAGVCERVEDMGPGVCERARPGEEENMEAERMWELKREEEEDCVEGELYAEGRGGTGGGEGERWRGYESTGGSGGALRVVETTLSRLISCRRLWHSCAFWEYWSR